MSISNDQIKQLLDRYFDGQTTLKEEKQLREIFRQQNIPSELKSLAPLFRYTSEMLQEGDSKGVETHENVHRQATAGEMDLFAKMDRGELHEKGRNASMLLRIAAGIILILTGFSAGLIVGIGSGADQQIVAVQEEVEQIKNALVYHAYQQTSASERIQAVGLVRGIAGADDHLLMVLIHTMNNDPNVNVRLASIDALRNYADQRGVRQAFVQALAVQGNPFVQLLLIDTLVELNERSAAGEMEKLLLAGNTEPEVKERLLEGIAELRT